MGLTELVTSVGDENILIQGLNASMTRIDENEGRTEIAFVTDQTTVDEIKNNTQKMFGIVMWIPVEMMPWNALRTLTVDDTNGKESA